MALFTAIGTALGATLLGSAALAGAAVVGSAALVGGSLYMQNQANRQQQRAAQFQRRQADLQAARQRRDTVRQNRMAQSQAVLTANTQGVSRSSGAMGGQDSIASQGYSNLSFMDTQNTLSDQASKAIGKAQNATNAANMFSGLANLAMSFYGLSQPTTPKINPVSNIPGASGRAPISYRGSSPYTHGSTNNLSSSFYSSNPRG